MLEKNKDYIEMRVSSTDFAFVQNEPMHLCVEGLVDATNGRVPGPGEDCIIISKEKFEALQTENEQLKNKLEECEKDYRINRDKSMLLEQEIKIYTKALQDWKEVTGYPSPSAVKAVIESGASWYHAYNEIKKANEKLADDVKSWKNVTGYSTPESFLSDRINNTCKIQKWKEATSCSTPEEAKELICSKNRGIVELKNKLDASLTENGELKKEVSDYKEQIKSLYKVIESWNKVTCCLTPEEAKDWVTKIGAANGNLAQAVLSWQEITGFSTPKNCSSYIGTLEKKLEDIKDLIEED